MKEMNDKYLLEHGYKQYNPTSFNSNSIVLMFQKCFKNDKGKKYFINVLKHSLNYLPTRDLWESYSYTYEVQVTFTEQEKPLNLEFFSDWTLEEVENFMEDFFKKMNPNHYELWS